LKKTELNSNKQNTNNTNVNETKDININNKKYKIIKIKRKYKESDEQNNNNYNNKKLKSFNINDILNDNYTLSTNKTNNVYSLLSVNEKLCEPFDNKDIYTKVDKKEWFKAVKDELDSMKDLNIYEVVSKVQKNYNIVTPKWVFRYKYNPDNTINKRKARLVTRGFTQKQGVDYNKTYSSTLKYDSLRTITALAVINGFNIYQNDLKSAYLNAELDEELYMKIPEGVEYHKKGYWKLKKALYGLKQSGRLWNNTLDKKLKK